MKARVVKNKVAPPFRTAEYDIMFGEGISQEADLLAIGVDMGHVQKSGSFYFFEDTRLGQGRENAKQFLKENDGIAAKIEGLIRGIPEVEHTPEAASGSENGVAAGAAT